MFESNSVKVSLFLNIMTVLLIGMIVIFSFTIYSVDNNIKDLSYKHANAYSMQISEEITNYLSKAYNSTTTLKDLFINKDLLPQNERRNIIKNQLRIILENNPDFLSVWSTWEPNALDNMDILFANTPGNSEKGRYTGTWFRDKNKIVYSGTSEQETVDADYYNIPKNSLKETFMEPYYYSYTGDKENEILETSIVLPLITDKFIGVVGIDIGLLDLQKKFNKIKIYESGYGVLMTETGMILTHPDAKKIGTKDNALTESQLAKIFEKINGEKLTSNITYDKYLKQRVYKCYAPINLGKSGKSWCYEISIPLSEILAKSRFRLAVSVTLSFLLLAILSLFIYMISKNISKPVLEATQITQQLAKGDLTVDIKKEGRSQNEIQQMKSALGNMIEQNLIIIKTLSVNQNHSHRSLLL